MFVPIPVQLHVADNRPRRPSQTKAANHLLGDNIRLWQQMLAGQCSGFLPPFPERGGRGSPAETASPLGSHGPYLWDHLLFMAISWDGGNFLQFTTSGDFSIHLTTWFFHHCTFPLMTASVSNTIF